MKQYAREKFIYWNQTDFVILDTETTGLGPTAEILEIAIIDHQGKTLVNSLVKPKGTISPDAEAIHGISLKLVQQSPIFPEIWQETIFPLIRDKKVLIYNADFDIRMIRQSLAKWNTPANFQLDTDCVMKTYAELIHSPRWLKLEKACGYKTNHRALGDTLATLDVIRKNNFDSFDQIAATYQDDNGSN